MDAKSYEAAMQNMGDKIEQKVKALEEPYKNIENGVNALATAADSFTYPNKNTTAGDNILQPAEYEKFRELLNAAGPITLNRNNVQSQNLSEEEKIANKPVPAITQGNDQAITQAQTDGGRGPR